MKYYEQITYKKIPNIQIGDIISSNLKVINKIDNIIVTIDHFGKILKYEITKSENNKYHIVSCNK